MPILRFKSQHTLFASAPLTHSLILTHTYTNTPWSIWQLLIVPCPLLPSLTAFFLSLSRFSPTSSSKTRHLSLQHLGTKKKTKKTRKRTETGPCLSFMFICLKPYFKTFFFLFFLHLRAATEKASCQTNLPSRWVPLFFY